MGIITPRVDFKVKDKKSIENQMASNLSRLKNDDLDEIDIPS